MSTTSRVSASPLVTTEPLPTARRLRLPAQRDGGVSERLAIGNAIARADALDRLGVWFPGYDFDQAARTTDARGAAMVALGPALLDHLGGAELVERVLGERDHYHAKGGLTFSRGDLEGHQPPPPGVAGASREPDRFSVQVGPLAGHLSRQWTTIINGADRYDTRLSAVCGDLERAYGAGVNTNIYLSYGPAEGFGAHWDTHDTLIVQAHGTKRWSVFEPLVLSAQRPWIGRVVSEEPVWQGDLEPGLAILIPRGWGHRVEGSDDLSMHLTIGIARQEVHDLVRRLAARPGASAAMQADVPFDPLTAPARVDRTFDDASTFARLVDEQMTPDLMSDALASHRASLHRMPPAALRPAFHALALDDWASVRLRLTAAAGVMLADETPDAIDVAFQNTLVHVATPGVEAFLTLVPGRPVAVGELPPVDLVEEDDGRLAFARAALEAGIVNAEWA